MERYICKVRINNKYYCEGLFGIEADSFEEANERAQEYFANSLSEVLLSEGDTYELEIEEEEE